MQAVAAPQGSGLRLWLVVAGLLAAALALLAAELTNLLPPGRWLQAARGFGVTDAQALVFHYSALPRAVVAFCAGAGLGLAGVLAQQVLRNPLASPTTLGVSAGAQLALVAASVFAPTLLGFGLFPVALVGSLVAIGVLLFVARSRDFEPLSLVLCGLVVGLTAWALATAIRLANQDYVAALYLWGAGSLVQTDWSVARILVPGLAVVAILSALLCRPLALFSLDDASLRGLGVNVWGIRLAALALSVGMSALLTASVGVISFLELAAPRIAAVAGAHRFRQQLIAAPLIAGALLLVVDGLVQLGAAATSQPIPTGAVTALLGAPVLLWLLPGLRLRSAGPLIRYRARAAAGAARVSLTALALFTLVVALCALFVGRGLDGWSLAGWDSLAMLAPWRVPRIVAACCAGGMLGVAGVLLQRLTGNPLASPELLGVGAGVSLGLAAWMVFLPDSGEAGRTVLAIGGALASLTLLLAFGLRSRFSPEPLLIAGLAVSAVMDGVVTLFLATGNPNAIRLVGFMAGAMEQVDPLKAAQGLAAALILLPLAGLIARPLDVAQLGQLSARSAGVAVDRLRAGLVLLAAALAACATLLVGPLSFVGLLGAHLARLLGFHRAAVQMAAAALIGAGCMTLADLIGRLILFPYDLPVGLVAALIGMPYLLWQLRRQ